MAGQIVNQAQTATPGTPVTVLNVNTTSQDSSGSAETDIYTYSLPANTLNANHKALRVVFVWRTATNSNNKVIKFYFGSSSTTVMSRTANNEHGTATFLIARTASGAQVRFFETRYYNDSTASLGAQYGQLATSAEADMGAITVKITGQGVSTGDVTGRMWFVEALN